MNWAGILVTAGIVAVALAWAPYSLPLLVGLVWVWQRS